MFKKIKFILIAALICFAVVACIPDEFLEDDDSWDDDSWEDDAPEDDIFDIGSWFDSDSEWENELIGSSGDPGQTWAVYWYICGSDLESEYGAATDDLYEMMDAELPGNVNVVIETGGAWEWMNDFVDESCIERYLYSKDGLELVDRKPQSDMGSSKTLADFLSFCEKNYPADHKMVIFWNHGGGSVSGALYDENYNYDQLTLGEFHRAFDAVYDLSSGRPPIDIIGFDACLMATIDTAYAFSDIAQYLVASEEMEPGCGWNYYDFLQALADDPGMDGARLGQYICESYMDGCGWFDGESTLSVTDLSRLEPLLKAYDDMGTEALSCALDDPHFFGRFGREAEASENYGGNTRDQGYSNLVDLGDLAENCSSILPHSSGKVLKALDDCIIYNVSGDYRENASGLSCYYSYNGDVQDFFGYQEVGCSDSFIYLYNYSLEGSLPQEGYELASSFGYEEETVPDIPVLECGYEDEFPLYLDDDGYAVLELDDDVLNKLKGVYFQLAYVDDEEDLMLMLGQDNDIDADWENGIFRDNFRGTWGCIDGYPVYMEVYYEGEDYTAFSVPILLNGKEYSLRVIYDYDDEEFYILGARRGLDDNGMADKNLIQLKPGDEITTIHYVSSFYGDDDFEDVPVDTFTVTEDTKFYETDMGDGVFVIMFELVDARNNSAFSAPVAFRTEGDYMDVEILD